MGKEWDKLGDVPKAKIRKASARDIERGAEQDGLTARRRNKPEGYIAGIPMQDWHQAWAEAALRVLKPSSYLLAFGGTRTWHRLACALEDAGFEIRDTLMWLYGSGFPKGKACLKPAWEPIILARKPGPMRELGIGECRVSSGPDHTANCDRYGVGGIWRKHGDVPGIHVEASPAGRWPANLVLDEEAGAMVDGQSGDKGGNFATGGDVKPGQIYGVANRPDTPRGYGDSGGPSRFFYCAKASRAERNAGCAGMEEREYTYNATTKRCTTCGCTSVVGHYPGAMACGHPMDVIERTPYQRSGGKATNHHPTVKPVALMRWLVRLVARQGDTVLDPFIGSGTTGVACATEGRDFIGIEREAEYVEIARRRIDAASAQLRLEVP